MEGQSRSLNRVREVGRPNSSSLFVSTFFSSSRFTPRILLPLSPFLSRRSAASRFYFVCAVARCSHLARPVSLSCAGRKWFTAVPERRFRRGSCACGGSTSNSFILRARSLPGPAALFATLLCSYGRFASRVAVFLRGISFFMHRLFNPLYNGISVFYSG